MVIVPLDIITLQTPERALYYRIVDPSRLVVHALADGTALQMTYILTACKLAALIAVDDFRIPMGLDRTFHRIKHRSRSLLIQTSINLISSTHPIKFILNLIKDFENNFCKFFILRNVTEI